MNGHNIVLDISIKYALFYYRDKDILSVIMASDNIYVICPGLKHIPYDAYLFSLIRYHLHIDDIGDIIFTLGKLSPHLPRDIELGSLIGLRIVDVIDMLEFKYDKVLEILDVLYIKLSNGLAV